MAIVTQGGKTYIQNQKSGTRTQVDPKTLQPIKAATTTQTTTPPPKTPVDPKTIPVDITQGQPLPPITTTTQVQQTAPEFYTNYLQDVANLGRAGIQQGGVAGFSPLQAQALSLTPQVAFAGSGSAGTGQEYLTAAGATPATSLVNQYLDPYMQNVVSEMGRLQQRGIQENVLPNLRAGAAGTGQFGSQRAAQVTGQTLRDLQADLLGRQYGALSEGYKGALQAAQTDLGRQLQAGQGLGQLGAVQQGLATQGLGTMFGYGAKEQELGQKVLDYPMQQAANFAKLMQGYQIPMGQVQQTVGSTGYSTSPLAQITGLMAAIGALGGSGTQPTSTQSTLNTVASGANAANSALNLGKTVLGK
jgi:hypothetical protein